MYASSKTNVVFAHAGEGGGSIALMCMNETAMKSCNRRRFSVQVCWHSAKHKTSCVLSLTVQLRGTPAWPHSVSKIRTRYVHRSHPPFWHSLFCRWSLASITSVRAPVHRYLDPRSDQASLCPQPMSPQPGLSARRPSPAARQKVRQSLHQLSKIAQDFYW